MNTGNKDRYVTIDRLSGRIATLLIGESERELIVDIGVLPAGSKEGDWLEIDVEGRLTPVPDITPESRGTSGAA